MTRPLYARIWRLLITPYTPDEAVRTYLERAQTQESPQARVTAAVLDAAESVRMFGVPLSRRGVQPVFLRVENRSRTSLRLQLVSIDPNYFTPLEAAAVNHFSLAKRLSALGAMWWFLLPLLPLLALFPLKLITAYLANGRMDDFFRDQGFRLGPVEPGDTSEGFVFTTLDSGTKVVHVRLNALGAIHETLASDGDATGGKYELPGPTPAAIPAPPAVASSAVEFTFTLPVPGIAADYLRRDFSALVPAATIEPCSPNLLVSRLQAMPPATMNAKETRTGDPVNLVVIGEFAMILSAFAARWDESESITLATCWKTAKAFVFGADYRYSPVSSLHLFGRNQDVALQRTRHSINERIHLRLWLTPLSCEGKPVWVGQVSRDIGVRFTSKAWNLTTHRIDPDVDEARDYVIEDLLQAERVEAAGYVDGVGACERDDPRRNLTGDPYYTDGKRAVIMLSPTRASPRFVGWG